MDRIGGVLLAAVSILATPLLTEARVEGYMTWLQTSYSVIGVMTLAGIGLWLALRD